MADSQETFLPLPRRHISAGRRMRRQGEEQSVQSSEHPEKLSPEEVRQALLEVLDLRGDLDRCQEKLRRMQTEFDAAIGFAQATIDALLTHICVIDDSGWILAVNSAWRRFAVENPPATEEATGVGINYFRVCDNATGADAEGAALFAEGIRAVTRGEKVEFSMEYPCHSPDEQRWFIGHVTRLAGGTPVRLVIAHETITARKKAEMELRVSLAEKEILLKEVHHRVKNNFAAIIGLVEILAKTFEARPAEAALADLTCRIKSMALVHEQLYLSGDLARIDMQQYLEALIGHLGQLYPRSQAIRARVVSQGVRMNLDCAIPCGLLVTELVTNAFKYAFPEERLYAVPHSCELTVTAEWDGAVYTLTVRDNGVGLPDNLDWKNAGTLGLMLVSMIGEHQLRGRIDLDGSGGTTCRLRFAPGHSEEAGTSGFRVV